MQQPVLPRYVVLQYTVSEHREALQKRLDDRRALAPLAPFSREGEAGTWQGIEVACYPGGRVETRLVPVVEQPDVEYVFALGLAGAMSGDLQRGDLVSPVASVRGDGLTDYWADPKLPAVADAHALRAVMESARRLGVPLATGIFYTTPTMYRELTFLEEWAQLGVIGIQMEIAQHFLLSHLHGKRAAGVYVVSDLPLQGDRIWRDGIRTDQVLLEAYERSIDVLLGAIQSLAESEAG